MAFCCKKLWYQLIGHDMSRTDLRDATGMAPATLAKLSKGEAVGMPTLEKIVVFCSVTLATSWITFRTRLKSEHDNAIGVYHD